MRGFERPVPSASLIWPRLFGRQTEKLKPNPGQRSNPKVRCSVEKLVAWNWRSGTGSVGFDLANRKPSAAPTASSPAREGSHSSAMAARVRPDRQLARGRGHPLERHARLLTPRGEDLVERSRLAREKREARLHVVLQILADLRRIVSEFDADLFELGRRSDP